MSGNAQLHAGAADLFRHVSAHKTAIHRAVLDTFAADKRQYRLPLWPDDVLAQASWPGFAPTAEDSAPRCPAGGPGQPGSAA